jgi:hypothetical protein
LILQVNSFILTKKASNGKLSDKQSLHSLSTTSFNDYQKAIISVGNILNYYDSDKKYPGKKEFH